MTKTTDPFAAYVMPLGLAEGVSIPLPGMPGVTFKVLLPGTMNEEFNMDVIASVSSGATVSEDGSVRLNSAKFQKARQAAFFDRCILAHEGLPEGMEPAEFFEKYGLAARVLFEEAARLAVIADEKATEMLEKLKPTQAGKRSGEAKKASTKP